MQGITLAVNTSDDEASYVLLTLMFGLPLLCGESSYFAQYVKHHVTNKSVLSHAGDGLLHWTIVWVRLLCFATLCYVSLFRRLLCHRGFVLFGETLGALEALRPGRRVDCAG